MITTKSKREIELMREAGRIVATVLMEVEKLVKPGVSTKELDDVAYNIIKEAGATPSFLNYHGFPASICASINDTLVHGIPDSKTVLKNGDIISIDVGAKYKGYHGDAARTFPVGEVSADALKLIEVTKESFYQGVGLIKPDVMLNVVCGTIGDYVESFGYSVPLEYTGHGIGSSLHEDPSIPNYRTYEKNVKLRVGMALAIEPMVHLGKCETKVLNDGWTVKTKDGSLSAHYENTIVVTEDGYEILTKL